MGPTPCHPANSGKNSGGPAGMASASSLSGTWAAQHQPSSITKWRLPRCCALRSPTSNLPVKCLPSGAGTRSSYLKFPGHTAETLGTISCFHKLGPPCEVVIFCEEDTKLLPQVATLTPRWSRHSGYHNFSLSFGGMDTFG